MGKLKNIVVAGASGTIGAPIVAALLAHGGFRVSALTRPESGANFPTGVTVKRADLSSRAALIEVLKGEDVVICTLNDAAAEFQPVIIDAAFQAGVKRFLQNEWASHDMSIPGTPMEEAKLGKAATIDLLNSKVKEAEAAGTEFHWTGIDNGTFFDWALHASFLDIKLPPSKTATVWDDGNIRFTCTNLSTVAAAVVAVLTTAEESSRDRLLNIESFVTSQNEIVAALEVATGENWKIQQTTTDEQLALARKSADEGDFLEAFYRWIRACIFSEQGTLGRIDNDILGLPKEDLRSTIKRIVENVSVE